MSLFAIKQERFEGPLALLLDVLKKKQLEITEVNLARIADDFLRYVEGQKILPEEMADFLVTASRLIHLKSIELLPDLSVEEEEGSLEEQLRLYAMFRETAEKIVALFGKRVLWSRQIVRKKETAVRFAPTDAVTTGNLHRLFLSIIKRLEPFFALQETTMEKVVSIEVRMKELERAILARKSFAFKDLVRGAKSRAEVVVSFLALLELVRRQVVIAEQHSKQHILIQAL